MSHHALNVLMLLAVLCSMPCKRPTAGRPAVVNHNGIASPGITVEAKMSALMKSVAFQNDVTKPIKNESAEDKNSFLAVEYKIVPSTIPVKLSVRNYFGFKFDGKEFRPDSLSFDAGPSAIESRHFKWIPWMEKNPVQQHTLVPSDGGAMRSEKVLETECSEPCDSIESFRLVFLSKQEFVVTFLYDVPDGMNPKTFVMFEEKQQ